MSTKQVERDERTLAVENASYRWAYLVLSYGLLAAVAYRSFVVGENAWELLALVVMGGVVATIRQGREHVLTRRWAMVTALTVLIAVVLAAALMLLGTNRS